jgi:hypothetical protein
MSKDYKPMMEAHCYACMNWDGVRSLVYEKKKILADDREHANCRFWHKAMQGSDTCNQFNPIQ